MEKMNPEVLETKKQGERLMDDLTKKYQKLKEMLAAEIKEKLADRDEIMKIKNGLVKDVDELKKEYRELAEGSDERMKAKEAARQKIDHITQLIEQLDLEQNEVLDKLIALQGELKSANFDSVS